MFHFTLTFSTECCSLLKIFFPVFLYIGLPWWHSGKESTCHCRRHKRLGFDSCVGKIPWNSKWQPNPVFVPGKFHGQRSLVGYSPWGHKEWDTIEHITLNSLARSIQTKKTRFWLLGWSSVWESEWLSPVASLWWHGSLPFFFLYVCIYSLN